MPLPSTLPGGLDIEAEGTGISAPLSRQVNLLGRAVRERYAAHAGGGLHGRLADEFERTERALLAIAEQESLLAHNPVIAKSIRLRNPHTDVLNLVQLALMRRWDRSPEEDLRRALFVSINGIAAAMRSTG